MSKIKRYAIEIMKRFVFVIVPLALALDPIQKWTNNKLATTTIMVAYVYASLMVIHWSANRKKIKPKSGK